MSTAELIEPENSSQPPNDGARLRRFGAAMVKYLLRARLQQEPRFLTSEQLHAWGLENIADDQRTVHQLLRMARDHCEKDRFTYLPCGSGGIDVWDGDRYEEIRMLIGFFISDFPTGLDTAVGQAKQGRPIDWPNLAEWDDLDRIRELLDQLPLSPAEADRPPGIQARQAVTQLIELVNDATAPKVNGIIMPLLSKTQ